MSVPVHPRVLVVDDDEAIRALLRFKLEERWYYVMEAADGEEALEIARSRQPDIILLDIEMPGLDGYQVLKQLKKDPELRPIPVILVTVRDQPRDIVLGLELGAVDHVSKPFDFNVLFARIRAHLREAYERGS